MKKKKKNKKKVKKKQKRTIVRKKISKKKIKKRIKKKISKKIKFHKKNIYKNKQKDNFALKIIRLQEKLKPNIKINIDFFKIDRAIQGFFQKIENKIQEFKKLRLEEKQRIEIKFLHLVLITLQPLGVYLDLLKNMRDRVQT